MIALLFVGDGDRDRVTLPRLVEGVLKVSVQEQFRSWKSLHLKGNQGYSRKLRFAVRIARDDGFSGVVAAVDKDKDSTREKLKELKEGRDADRASNPPLPVALSEAEPHGEAWLLDDDVAVRRALNLDANCQIPTVRGVVSPKDALEDLRRLGRGDDNILEVLSDIARQVELTRCHRPKDTGFHKLVEEIRGELGSVASQCGEGCRCGDACSAE